MILSFCSAMRRSVSAIHASTCFRLAAAIIAWPSITRGHTTCSLDADVRYNTVTQLSRPSATRLFPLGPCLVEPIKQHLSLLQRHALPRPLDIREIEEHRA